MKSESLLSRREFLYRTGNSLSFSFFYPCIKPFSYNPRNAEEWLERWMKENEFDNLERRISESVELMEDNSYRIRNKAFLDVLAPLKELSRFYNPLPVEVMETLNKLSSETKNFSIEQQMRIREMHKVLEEIQRNSSTNYPPVSNNAYSIILDLNENFCTNFRVDNEIEHRLWLETINLNGRNSLTSLIKEICDKTSTKIITDSYNRDCFHIVERGNERLIAYDKILVTVNDNKVELLLDPHCGRFLSVEKAYKNSQVNEDIEIFIPELLPDWEFIGSEIYKKCPDSKTAVYRDRDIETHQIKIELITAVYPFTSRLVFDNEQDLGFQKRLTAHKEENDDGTYSVEISSTPFPESFWEIRRNREFMYTRAAADASSFRFYDKKSRKLKSDRIKTTIVRRDINWLIECEDEPEYVEVKTYDDIIRCELFLDRREIF
ncbi:hypothetical protein J4221_00150 [Candidatus Pacearchaeota archaeon]|nr:hypothetical protein [Candidatus Pacearchaeota archaeon]